MPLSKINFSGTLSHSVGNQQQERQRQNPNEVGKYIGRFHHLSVIFI